jgi:hypothetical protein
MGMPNASSSLATVRVRAALRVIVRILIMLACLTLVGSSLTRLAFLVHPPAAAMAALSDGGGSRSSEALTDAAFVRHSALGFAHIVPGVVMVLLGPLQFSARLRARAPRAHRWLGRCFLLMSLGTASAGLVMNFTFPPSGGWLQTVVLFATGVGLIATVGLGWRAIRVGDMETHRVWMTRAWGIALAGGTTGLVALPLYLLQGELGRGFIGGSRLVGVVVAVAVAEAFAQRRAKVTVILRAA